MFRLADCVRCREKRPLPPYEKNCMVCAHANVCASDSSPQNIHPGMNVFSLSIYAYKYIMHTYIIHIYIRRYVSRKRGRRQVCWRAPSTAVAAQHCQKKAENLPAICFAVVYKYINSFLCAWSCHLEAWFMLGLWPHSPQHLLGLFSLRKLKK